MLPIASQTAGAIGQNFLVDTHRGVIDYKKFYFFSTGNAGPFSEYHKRVI